MNVGRGKEADDVGHDLGGPAAVEAAVLPHHEAVLVALTVGQQDVRQFLHDLLRAGCHLESVLVDFYSWMADRKKQLD